jgi:hypothetical protein
VKTFVAALVAAVLAASAACPRRGMLAMSWVAQDPRLLDGTPGSTTATIRWRYRTGNAWSAWHVDGDGHGPMRTLSRCG